MAELSVSEYPRSRKKGMSVTVTVNGKRLTVTADNAEEVIPVLDRFLDG